MSFTTTYLLNVALHSALLSVFAGVLAGLLRRPGQRSCAIIAGLLAVGLLPWVTALRPGQPDSAPVPKVVTQLAALPVWTIATVPMETASKPIFPPPVAPAGLVVPGFIAMVVLTWAVGTGVGLVLFAIAFFKLTVWRGSLKNLDEAAWHALQNAAPEIPARRHLRSCEIAASPCVIGFWRPAIVIPAFMLENGSEEELGWALRHETAHWRAGDSRWIFVFTLIRCMHWWNPLVHRLASGWADSREQLCDLQATSGLANRAGYGEFLIAMAAKVGKPAPLAVAMAKRPRAVRLKRRIVLLLDAMTESGRPAGKRFISLSTAVFLGYAAIISSVKIHAEELAKEKEAAADTGSVGKPAGTPPADERGASVQAPEVQPAGLPPANLVIESPPVGQLFMAYKLVMMATPPIMKDGAIMTDAELQIYMRTLASTKGVTLMTAPKVTARFGQTATIEIIREVLGRPEQIAARDPKSPAPFTGIRLENKADLVDDHVDLIFNPEFRFIPDSKLPLEDISKQPAPGTDPDKIKIAKRAVNARLSAGQTLCTDLGEIIPGKFLHILTTVQPINAAGLREDNFKNGRLLPADRPRNQSHSTSARKIPGGRETPSDALPSPEVKGKAHLNAVLVEILLKAPRLPGEELVLGLTPSDPKVAAAIRNTPGAKVRKLPTIEMPLNHRGTPWVEFPALSVSAIASKDFKLITITSHAVGDGVGEFPNMWEDMTAGSTMNFGIQTRDTAIERRLLITIEAAK